MLCSCRGFQIYLFYAKEFWNFVKSFYLMFDCEDSAFGCSSVCEQKVMLSVISSVLYVYSLEISNIRCNGCLVTCVSSVVKVPFYITR